MKGSVMDDYPAMTQCFSRVVGGAKAAGKWLGKSARTICGWLSGDHAPDVVSTIKMRNILIKSKNKEGYGISLEELERRLGVDLSHLRHPRSRDDTASAGVPILKKLGYFDRLDQGLIRQAQGGERRGRSRKNALNPEEKNSTCVFLAVYTDAEMVADYGLGSVDTLRRAKKIRKEERYELMQAVHVGLIPMSDAQKLLVIPPVDASLQSVLSSGNKKAIQAFMKARGLK